MTGQDSLPLPDVGALARSADRAFDLDVHYSHLGAVTLLRHIIHGEFPGRVTLVSSFGAESAVLLHLVARIEPALPVIFLDTGKLFGETLRYSQTLAQHLGLTGLRVARPDPHDVAREDTDGLLFQRDLDRCCRLRKVAPLRTALKGFDAWITGRKAYQGSARAGLPLFESDGARVKINPLATWRKEAVDAYFACHDLPRHPLQAGGYHSIGCTTCTDRVAPGEGPRDGRWRGTDKTECGIHFEMPER